MRMAEKTKYGNHMPSPSASSKLCFSILKFFKHANKNLSIHKNLRTLKTNFEEADGLGISYFTNKFSIKNLLRLLPMPSPSAFSKFASSILKFFEHPQFFMYSQNHFGILKS